MNPADLKRLFPNASLSTIKANLDADNSGSPADEHSKPADALTAGAGEGLEDCMIDKDNNSCDNKSDMNLDLELLYKSYQRTGSCHRTALEFSTCGETVRRALIQGGKKMRRLAWTRKEDEQILELSKKITAREVAIIVGRSKHSVNIRLSKLERGLIKSHVGNKAPKKCLVCGKGFVSFGGDAKKFCSRECCKKDPCWQAGLPNYWKNNKNDWGSGDCKTCGKHFVRTSKNPTQEFCSMPCAQSNLDVTKRRIETTRLNPNANKTSYATCRKGWMELGGKRIFARSSWEANYARYLQFQKDHGLISDWEHEPKTFWFEKIKRGVRSYLPDFKVTFQNGAHEWHEVKGWMDAKSKTKLKRMGKYYPQEKMRVLDGSWFKDANRKLSSIIPGWVSAKSMRRDRQKLRRARSKSKPGKTKEQKSKLLH